MLRKLDVEVALAVVGGDVLNHLAQSLDVSGILAVLNPAADQVAHNAAEVLVTGIGQEGTGVGQHADEVAQQAQVGQGSHLLDHAGLGVVEPPAGTMLNLTGNLRTLECAQEGAQPILNAM